MLLGPLAYALLLVADEENQDAMRTPDVGFASVSQRLGEN